MSKVFRRLVYLIFVAYVLYNQVLISNYETLNDKLSRVNDTLLKTCTVSNLDNIEEERYK